MSRIIKNFVFVSCFSANIIFEAAMMNGESGQEESRILFRKRTENN